MVMNTIHSFNLTQTLGPYYNRNTNYLISVHGKIRGVLSGKDNRED